jgi:hypothetical protein
MRYQLQNCSEESQMPNATQEVLVTLCAVTQKLPIGTNLALLHFMWMLVSGALLNSRGAVFPALLNIGLCPSAVRRAWAAFRYGAWRTSDMLRIWHQYVLEQGKWQVHEYEGYRPKAVDITAFWRPTLRGNDSKHYHPQAGKALPAIVLGVVGVVGSVCGHRVALPEHIVRADAQDPREITLQTNLLKQAAETLGDNEIAVLDAGFKLKAIHAAGVKRYVVRLAKNFTARRNEPAPYKGQGRRPVYGSWVRPLSRKRKGKTIPATPPDQVLTWEEAGRTLRAHIWFNLVLPGIVPGPKAQAFTVFAIYDPDYKEPLLLATPLELQAPSMRGLYRDRWPVEQVPLAAKHMVGAHRQFVFAPESCQRLPELALLAGSILTYLAATLPAIPTGFWDRKPQPTPGRLRRLLARSPFPITYPLPTRFRKKASVTAHLLKGISGHRRSKASVA